MTDQLSEIAEIHWLMDTLQSVDVGLMVLDRDYKIQLFNGFMENHSGLRPSEVRGKKFFLAFPSVNEDWFRRKIDSVFLLKSHAFSTWEQRPYLIKFKSYRPITGKAPWMYQNITIIPLLSADGSVNHICVIIYDVTDIAVGKKALQAANYQLERLSQTDGLTGLLNRATWENLFQHEFKRGQRTGQHCSVVMLDIDHFKNINDTYGHPAGDEAIRLLSRIITEQKRETDVAGRYGGEEFCVTLIDTTAEKSVVFAERLRKKIEAASVIWEGEEIKYTISLGIAELSADLDSHESWLQNSDKALYYSKEHGRNQVTVYRDK